MSKQYEVIVVEKLRVGYLVDADSELDARRKIEHPEEDYPKSFEEYYDLDSIESVEEDI